MNKVDQLDLNASESLNSYKRKHEDIDNDISEAIDSLETNLIESAKRLCSDIRCMFNQKLSSIEGNIEDLGSLYGSLLDAQLRLSHFRDSFYEFQKDTLPILIDKQPTDDDQNENLVVG